MAWDRFSTSSLAKIWVMLFAHGLLRKLQTRRDLHDRHFGIPQRERAMLELPGGIRLGVNVGDFLELEGALEGNRVVDTAAEEKRMLLAREALRPRLDLRLEVERVLNTSGHEAQLVEGSGLPARFDPPLRLGDCERQREKRNKLCREGLRPGHADLGP